MHPDMPSLIIDIIGIFDAETAELSNDNSPPSEKRMIFQDIVKKTEGFFSGKLLKERLKIDTLQDAGIIKEQSNVGNDFYQRFIKVKTKL